MARTTLSVQESGPGGVQISWTALNADGQQFVYQDGCRILVKNGSTGLTLTIPTSQTVQGLAVDDRDITIASDEDYDIRLDDERPYLQTGSMIHLDYSDVSDGEVAIVH